jgi:hypothetical protein
MISIAPGTDQPTDQRSSITDVLEAAARRMYEAEIALHAARQSQVDAWVTAAYERCTARSPSTPPRSPLPHAPPARSAARMQAPIGLEQG